MQQTHFAQIGNLYLIAKVSDNYINATELCRRAGRQYKNWSKSDGTRDLIVSFVESMIVELFMPENQGFLNKVISRLTSVARSNENPEILLVPKGTGKSGSSSKGNSSDSSDDDRKTVAMKDSSRDDDSDTSDVITLSNRRYNVEDVKKVIRELAIVYEDNGRQDRATWVHPLLGIQLAAWVSPNFAMQVSRWIYKLLINGVVELKERDMQFLRGELSDRDEQMVVFKQQTEALRAENAEIKHQMELAIREKSESDAKLDAIYQTALAERGQLVCAQSKLIDVTGRVVPRVSDTMTHNIAIIRKEYNKTYRVIHRQSVSYDQAIRREIGEDGEDGEVISEHRDVPCGLKIIDVLRGYAGGAFEIRYADVTFNYKRRRGRGGMHPCITEDNFVDMVAHIIDG